MENALSNGKIILASEIAKDYLLEKEIRKASGRKEIFCPDPECHNNILRYCHGEEKEAYFAHLNNDQCDYALFDKSNSSTMRMVRQKLYEHFKKKGYNVKSEVKILSNHYTHLLFDMEDGTKLALEIGTQRISANQIEYLTNEYQKAGVLLKWIVLDSTDKPVIENHTYFIKRYLLNESLNMDLLVVNWNGIDVAQYKVDPNRYEHNGQCYTSTNYPEMYTEQGILSDLTFDGNELSLAGYHIRFNELLIRKRNAFNKKIKQYEEEKRAYIEEIKRRENEKSQIPTYAQSSVSINSIITDNNHTQAKDSITYEQRREQIIAEMNQQQQQVRDSLGIRWIKCEICGAVEISDKFSTYGGINHINLGICNNCSKNNRKVMVIN